jgi:hypothetical protein
MLAPRIAVAAVMLQACAAVAAAQFHIPLPPHVSADSAYHIYSDECGAARQGTIPSPTIYTHRLNSPDSIAVTAQSCKLSHWLTVRDVFRGDKAVRQIYGGEGIQVLNDFAGTFKRDRVFLQSSIVRGTIGPVFFDASYAQFFSSQDSDDPNVPREELRDVTGNLLRLIQNGGSAAGRVVLPLLWGGGGASQQAAGMYFNLGVTGPLGNSDSVQATLGTALDLLATFAIRNVASYDVDADLFLGVRPGVQVVLGEQSLLPDRNKKTIAFLQFAGGLRVGGESRLSALFTLVPSRFKPFVPDFQLNLQVPKL